MATAPVSRKLNLTRDQLAQFLTDQQQIRQFELLFTVADTAQYIPDELIEVNIVAGNAQATANDALAQIIALAKDAEMMSLAPRAELGTIASQNSDNVNITGGLISGLNVPLPVASGGIGVTTSAANRVFSGPTTGAAAAPTFRALVAADIPALPYGTGTVTSVAALTLGTTGTDLSSTVANSTTTPVITLNVPTSSATNRGALSSTDWSTFNNKEPAIAAGTTSQYWRGDKSWQDFATSVRASVLTGLSTATNAVITAADTVLSAFGKLQAQITDHVGASSGVHGVTGSVVGTTDSQTLTNKVSIGIGTATPVGVLDAIGKAYLGTTRNATLNNVNASVHIYGDGGEGQLALTRGTGAANYFMRTVAGTIAAPTAIGASVGLGQLTFQGWNGTAFNNGATISVNSAEAFAGTGSGSRLIFSTTSIGSTAVTERFRIRETGEVVVTNAAGLGYGTGAGGTVTQGTSRTTGVTLSKPTGGITMFSAAGSVVAATFTVTNTLVAATDTIILNQQSGTNLYVLLVTAVAAGSFNITFYTTGGVATDAPVINFSIIKGVTA